MPRMLVLVAGLPRDILGPLIQRLRKSNESLDVLETLPLDSVVYNAKYADDLHGMVGSGLRKDFPVDRRGSWDLNFVVLYLRTADGSERHVVERFDMEALLVPLAIETAWKRAPKRHKTRALIKRLVSRSIQMLCNARLVLRSLAQEVTNRDTRTCVLLPRANFGAEFEKVKECVQGAVANLDSARTFDAAATGCRGSVAEGFGRTLSEWASCVPRSVEGRCQTRSSASMGHEGARRPLRNTGPCPFRRAIRSEIPLRLRSRAKQRETLHELPRGKGTEARTVARQYRAERQHQIARGRD